jgi:hypothetical protein
LPIDSPRPSVITRVVLIVALCAGASLPGATAASAATRGFELVTPPDAGAYPPTPLAARPDGSSFYWATRLGSGDPAGEDNLGWDAFVARRGAGGWATEWLTPGDTPADTFNALAPGMAVDGLVYVTSAGLVPEDQNSGLPFPAQRWDVYRVGLGAPKLLSAPAGGQSGTSGIRNDSGAAATPDLEAVAFQTNSPLIADDQDGASDVYLRRGDDLVLVSRQTNGDPDNNGADAFLSTDGRDIRPQGFPATQGRSPLSEDGQSVVFQTDAQLDPADTDFSPDLYLWRNGQVVLVGGAAAPVDCDPFAPQVYACPTMAGMPADASRIYFATPEQLVAEDTDADVDVYEYTVQGGTLALASAAGAATGASYPITVTRDGVLFYLDADRVIHRWDGADTTIATLSPSDQVDPGADRAGNVVFQEAQQRPVRATAPGDALLFETLEQLAPGDTDDQLDIYLWREGEGVALVSVGGTGAYRAFVGSPIGWGLQNQPIGGRVINADASRAFFTSADALTGDAPDNGREKVYEWEAGTVRLISPAGPDAAAAMYVDSSVSGDDVFFRTADTLTSRDADGGEFDIYDARVGGGFPEPTPSPIGSTPSGGGPGQLPGSPAVGSLTPSLDAGPPATDGSRPGADGGDDPGAAVPTAKLLRRTLIASKSGIAIPVDVSDAGAVRIVLIERGAKGRKARLIGTGSRDFRSAVEGRVPVHLTKAGRRALRRGTTVRVSVRVIFTPSGDADRVSRTYKAVVRARGAATKRGSR